VRFWAVVSVVLGPVPLRLLDTVVAVGALVSRNVRAALLLLACGLLNGFVTLGAKALANRPRPPTMLLATPQTSFPSGHALETMAALLALLAVVLPMMSRTSGHVAITVSALILVLVGISRVALNVHHPSDVLAGWSLGYLYVLGCLWVLRPKPLPRWAFR
jgi:membrane-associated phospholipid phosphatase